MHMYIKKRNEKTQSISMTCILSREKIDGMFQIHLFFFLQNFKLCLKLENTHLVF